ncbi:MAG TPA: ABC transporter ATP-binding protein [Candidatus Dormibacteraeota bacterium]|nr:ABC transporter ATP-binding protein [Candidatus Dormibacteraeota bacterium]
MLEALQLTKKYSSIPAVQDLSFTLRPGQVLGCLGPNGSGKSTTVKMLTGLLEPTRGVVQFDGHNIQDDLASYRMRLGYVPEEAHLYPYLTGWEYLEMVGTLRGMGQNELNVKIDALLQLFSLHGSRHASIGTYSKGMRQRVLLIAAIMHDPEIFIFDEPLSGLDVTSALIFKNLVQALGRAGKLVFYCSHVLEVVEKVCSDVLILRKGVVIAHDSVANMGKILGESLENTFLHLVDDVDTMSVARDIVDVMKAA